MAANFVQEFNSQASSKFTTARSLPPQLRSPTSGTSTTSQPLPQPQQRARGALPLGRLNDMKSLWEFLCVLSRGNR